jgi:hypothetical protein
MDKVEKATRMKHLFEQIVSGKSIESMSIPIVETERGGLEGIDANPALKSALQKLAEDRPGELTTKETFGLEAIVLPTNRPVTFTRHGSYTNLEIRSAV